MKQLRFLCLIALGAISAILFSSCGTTSSRALPAYEPPIAKSDFQTVHTTAYTHTESDHLQFTNHNALGGELQAAGPPIHRAENTRSPIELDYRVATYTPAPQPFLMSDEETKSKRVVRKATAVTTTTTTATTRTVKTWALAGRNTIDLYMATQAEMNAWGARQEPIQILRWGDSEESLRHLLPHQDYRHIRRMVLELQGNEEAAAQLQ